MKPTERLKKAEDLFSTSARTAAPTPESLHRKPSGNGDQRTSED
ncbi:hypothetical protein [Streptomyces sp. NPDC049906]